MTSATALWIPKSENFTKLLVSENSVKTSIRHRFFYVISSGIFDNIWCCTLGAKI